MSHTPDEPKRYVCTDCQGVYAGAAHKHDGSHTFEAPSTCAACGGTSFVEFAQWTHASTSGREA